MSVLMRRLSRGRGTCRCGEQACALLHVHATSRRGDPIYRILPMCERHALSNASRHGLEMPAAAAPAECAQIPMRTQVQPLCACGWAGAWVETPEAAMADLAAHHLAQSLPAHGTRVGQGLVSSAVKVRA